MAEVPTEKNETTAPVNLTPEQQEVQARLKTMPDDVRAEILKDFKTVPPAKAPEKPHTPEKAPEKHDDHTQKQDHALVETPTYVDSHGPSQDYNYDKKSDVTKMSTPGKIATLAGIGGAATLATAIGNGLRVPQWLETTQFLDINVGANALHAMLENLTAPLINSVGLWPTLGITAVGGAAILYGLGKAINTVVRIFKRDHPNTGWGPKNMWYAIKSPFAAAGAAFNWATGLLPKAVARVGHELRNVAVAGTTGAAGIAFLSWLMTGGIPTAGGLVVGGLAVGYGTNVLYRLWNRFAKGNPSTLGAKTASSGDAIPRS